MTDFLEDSLAIVASRYAKEDKTVFIRAQLVSEINSFMNQILSPQQPQLARIAAYSVDGTANAGNTQASMAAGVYRVKVPVQLNGSMDFIVLDVTSGEGVVV